MPLEKLDYYTTPGYFDGPGGREREGYKHGGPACVISDKAIMRFDATTKEMVLDRFFPGITPGDIRDCTGFSIDIHRAEPLEPPTTGELDTLRREVDPQRLILGND